MKYIYFFQLSILLLGVLALLIACGAPVDQNTSLQSTAVDRSFQSQVTAVPTRPTYICGAWSSNNVPGTYGSLFIYAKLTKDLTGVAGAVADAVVHFKGYDVTLDQKPISDNGGYVTFLLSLQGRQPRMVAATVDITFSVNATKVQCSQAFFTPQ